MPTASDQVVRRFGMYSFCAMVLAMLAVMGVSAKKAGDAARTDRERWRAARDAAFGPPRS